jgi:hypothetical protein
MTRILLISYLYSIFFVLAFMADRLPFIAFMGRVSFIARNSVQTIQSTGLNDNQKQKLLLANSGLMFLQSVKIFVLILIVAAFGLLFSFLANVFNTGNQRFLMDYAETWRGILLSILAFLSFFCIKKVYVRVKL